MSEGIPKSVALRAANPASVQELFSRDPEGFNQQDFDVVIEHMRQLREKLAATETIRQVRVAKAPSPRAAKLLSNEPIPDGY